MTENWQESEDEPYSFDEVVLEEMKSLKQLKVLQEEKRTAEHNGDVGTAYAVQAEIDAVNSDMIDVKEASNIIHG